MNVPTENLSSTIGGVAIPALSRLQNDPQRLRSYFLKGYALLVSLLMPITMASALFVEDFVRILLGPKWDAAAPLCRLLAPTMLALSLINPVGWLMLATGRATRSLKIASLSAPIVILGYLAGLSYGPQGVAAGFSIAAVLLVVPVIFWATRGTSITAADMLSVVVRPGLSILIAAGATLVCWNWVQVLDWPLLRLIAGNTILFGVYGIVLLFVMGQRDLYLGLIREIGILRFAGRRTKRTMGAGLAEPQASEQRATRNTTLGIWLRSVARKKS
jgi:PST family polysaccharide transporter